MRRSSREVVGVRSSFENTSTSRTRQTAFRRTRWVRRKSTEVMPVAEAIRYRRPMPTRFIAARTRYHKLQPRSQRFQLLKTVPIRPIRSWMYLTLPVIARGTCVEEAALTTTSMTTCLAGLSSRSKMLTPRKRVIFPISQVDGPPQVATACI